MKSSKISLIIDSVCHQHGIEYCSLNPHLQTMVEDAQKLSEIYTDLKIIMGDLQDIEERHDIKPLNKKIEDIIKTLNSADHDIIRLARDFKAKEEK
jgi:hypothetical protein